MNRYSYIYKIKKLPKAQTTQNASFGLVLGAGVLEAAGGAGVSRD